MKFPASHDPLTESFLDPAIAEIEPVADYALIYPPVGFLSLPVCHLGNGDDYGFYGPVGKEQNDPLVALMSHDYAGLGPIASSTEGLARQKVCPDLDEEEPEERPDVAERLTQDDRSPYLLVANADLAVAQNELDRAESLYLKATEALPEYTAAHYGLVLLYRRQRKPREATKAMLDTIRSPLAFRGASFWAETFLPTENVNRTDFRRKCLLWLQASSSTDPVVADDPLYQARHRLTFANGVKEHGDYLVYDEVIEAYLKQERCLDAVRLTMTYGELMMCETTPFRERSGFTLSGYRARLKLVFQQAKLMDRLVFLC